MSMETALFLHRNGRISRLPKHFATSRIGRNLTLIEEGEIETEKVVLENVANSQLRTGRKAKPKKEAPVEAEPHPIEEASE